MSEDRAVNTRPEGLRSPARPPRRNPAPARERIIKTATAEFARHGFAGARIARIVARSGSNPRMVYHYFGSKSALYVAVLEEVYPERRIEAALVWTDGPKLMAVPENMVRETLARLRAEGC